MRPDRVTFLVIYHNKSSSHLAHIGEIYSQLIVFNLSGHYGNK